MVTMMTGHNTHMGRILRDLWLGTQGDNRRGLPRHFGSLSVQRKVFRVDEGAWLAALGHEDGRDTFVKVEIARVAEPR